MNFFKKNIKDKLMRWEITALVEIFWLYKKGVIAVQVEARIVGEVVVPVIKEEGVQNKC